MADSTTNTSLDALDSTIQSYPSVDTQSYSLLRAVRHDSHSLLDCITEARDEAQVDAPKSLPYYRALKQLTELYGCKSGATWEELMSKRKELYAADFEGFTKKCLEQTKTLLLDDRADKETHINRASWHNQFTSTKSMQILRIEQLAADMMQVMWEEGEAPLSKIEDLNPDSIWPVFLEAFEHAMNDEIANPNVAGFKSVVASRTGLDILPADDITIMDAGLEGFRRYVRSVKRGDYHIRQKGLNDCLIMSACKLLTASTSRGRSRSGASRERYSKDLVYTKPLQFQSGMKNDASSFADANPILLQPLIDEFPAIPFVLLGAGYPYTKEASYLVTINTNAYLDFGGVVFPRTSLPAQKQVIKEAMQVAPLNKIMFSTDARYFPEAHWLAQRQFREALGFVMNEFVKEELLTLNDAINVSKDILAGTAERIYDLVNSLKAAGSHHERKNHRDDEESYDEAMAKAQTLVDRSKDPHLY